MRIISSARTGLVLVCVLGSCVGAARAEEEKVLQTQEVVVTSTRLPDVPVEVRELPAKATVITSEDIRKSGARTIQEALQWTTGIAMYDQIGNAFQQTIDLRGFNGQPVPGITVFVDGARINEPDFNTVNFDLIPYETIERIEIIPGSSAIYGKNALGGVINIITKRGGDQRQVTGEGLWGSFHRERYTINASGPVGKFDYYTNFSRETENGFRNESDARLSRFYGRLGYRPTDRTDLTLSYTYVTDRLLQAGLIPLSTLAFDRKANITPGDFVDNETNVVRLTGRQDLPFGFTVNLNGFYRRLGQEQFGVGQPASPGAIPSTGRTGAETESRGGTVQLSQHTPILGHRNALIIGTEITRNDFGSRLLSTSSFGPFANRTDTNENIVGVYAQDAFHLTPSLILTGGVRYDRSRIETDFEDSFTTPASGKRVFHRTTPRAGLTYLVNPDVSVYVNYSQGFRTPTFLELFPVLGLSNPFLKPVRSDNYEVGSRIRVSDWGELSAALYQTDLRDEIFFTCMNCDVFSTGFDGLNRNIDRSRRRGVEGTFKVHFGRHFDGTVNYTFTEATVRSRFQSSATEIIEVGDSLPLVPKHRLSVIGNLHPAEGWTLSLMGLYVSTQVFLNDQSNSQPRIPGYFVLNSRVAYERTVPGGRLTGFILLNNVLDQKYSTFGNIAVNNLTGGGAQERFFMPAPGIAVFGGVSYRFEGW